MSRRRVELLNGLVNILTVLLEREEMVTSRHEVMGR